jgi:hypothetical protein
MATISCAESLAQWKSTCSTDTASQKESRPDSVGQRVLGAFPIAEALDREPTSVTGRVNDAALALPMIHEFGWEPAQHDLWPRGRWRDTCWVRRASFRAISTGMAKCARPCPSGVSDRRSGRRRFLIVTIHQPGEVITPAVLKEQLYEIGDRRLIVADVISDTQVEMEDLGVQSSAGRGCARPSPTPAMVS